MDDVAAPALPPTACSLAERVIIDIGELEVRHQVPDRVGEIGVEDASRRAKEMGRREMPPEAEVGNRQAV